MVILNNINIGSIKKRNINRQHYISLLLLLLLCNKILDINCWSSTSSNVRNIQRQPYKYSIINPNCVTTSTKTTLDNKVHANQLQVPTILTLTSLYMNKDEDDIGIDDDDDDDDEVIQNNIGNGMTTASNVIGTNLCECCSNVRNTGIGTGFYRNGYCSTGDNDIGRHTVCVEVTTEFLQYSKNVGNDLSTPMIEYMFPGLKHGDKWCLCAERWVQAYNAGVAPKLLLQSTHEKTLSYISYDILQQYAIDQTIATTELDKLNTIRNKLNKLL